MSKQQQAVAWAFTVLFCVSCQSPPEPPSPPPPVSETRLTPTDAPGVNSFVSAYGFSMEVSPEWMALTKETIPGALEAGEEFLPESAKREILARVASNMELLMNFESGDSDFVDNISVIRASGTLPTSTADVLTTCRNMGVEISTAYGREAHVFECGASKVDGRRALFSKFEGVMPGTLSSQYHVGAGESEIVTITATYAISRATDVDAEFKRIVTSLRFQ